MKYALISPAENWRFCEVSERAFPVAPPLLWVEVQDDVSVVTHDYVDGSFVAKPPPPPPPPPAPASGVKEM